MITGGRNRARRLAHQARLYRTRRAEWIKRQGGGCKRCGSHLALQVDHIDPATKEARGFWLLSEPRREAELAKCQLLCRACHNYKTWMERKVAKALLSAKIHNEASHAVS